MTKAGYVALVGRPNAGKSTLMNAFLGEKLSIVTPKAQTTWRRVTGIYSDEAHQIIFLDTPGLLAPRDMLQRSMAGAAREAISEADVMLVVLETGRRGGPPWDVLSNALEGSTAPRFVAVNKTDVAEPRAVAALVEEARERLRAAVFPVSALKGTNIDRLRDAVKTALPESPFLYPDDVIASDPVRFFTAELVRESVFELYGQEIPYSVFCQVEEFREDAEPAYIRVMVYVERSSQKGILIGDGGRAIRELGTSARIKIERLMGRPVYLDLWVKVLAGWRRKRGHLQRLGFRIPHEHETVDAG